MSIEELRKLREILYQIAARHGIKMVYVFGSVVRGESGETSDIDFLVELEAGASPFGVGGFQYDVQELLGIEIDVIPTFALAKVKDFDFVDNVQSEAVAL
ncbi:MAG: nucleotidyltransferase domain-containing protein [Chloroflexota bacterium]|nr:nucleotidyltransferase domain-containing protein [Chloroflexota bacterium]